jgi:hypothetical protein
MSNFFDQLGDALKRTVDSVSADVSVAAEEQKVREQYQALGKLYYHAIRTGKPLEGIDFADRCRKIDASLARIRDLKERKNVTDPFAEDTDFETVD